MSDSPCSRCNIYADRPEACRLFPQDADALKDFPSCTFWFDEQGNRQGCCCDCGECCVYPPSDTPGYQPEWGDGRPCPHLGEV